MKRFRLYKVLISGLLLALGFSGAAGAASTVSLVSQTPSVVQGGQAIFELWMDFTGDPTIGGDIDIAYHNFTDGNQLNFVSYTPYLGNPDYLDPGNPNYQPGLQGDPGWTSAPYPDTNGWAEGDPPIMAPSPIPGPNGLTGIAVGDPYNGIEGAWLIGTLVFSANVAGGPYSLTASDGVNGGFYSFTNGSPQLAQYNNLDASVTADPVPLPAAAWLFLSGTVGMTIFVRRRKPA